MNRQPTADATWSPRSRRWGSRHHCRPLVRPICEPRSVRRPRNRRGHSNARPRIINPAQCSIAHTPESNNAFLLPEPLRIHKWKIPCRHQARAIAAESNRSHSLLCCRACAPPQHRPIRNPPKRRLIRAGRPRCNPGIVRSETRRRKTSGRSSRQHSHNRRITAPLHSDQPLAGRRLISAVRRKIESRRHPVVPAPHRSYHCEIRQSPARESSIPAHRRNQLRVRRQFDQPIVQHSHGHRTEEQPVHRPMNSVTQPATRVVHSEIDTITRIDRLVRAAGAMRLQHRINQRAIALTARSQPPVGRSKCHPPRNPRRPSHSLDAVPQGARRRCLPHHVRRTLAKHRPGFEKRSRCCCSQKKNRICSHITPPSEYEASQAALVPSSQQRKTPLPPQNESGDMLAFPEFDSGLLKHRTSSATAQSREKAESLHGDRGSNRSKSVSPFYTTQQHRSLFHRKSARPCFCCPNPRDPQRISRVLEIIRGRNPQRFWPGSIFCARFESVNVVLRLVGGACYSHAQGLIKPNPCRFGFFLAP
jgi:hypothetical protein